MARVLIIDDSPVVRTVFSRAFDADRGLEVVGTAGDAYQARDLIVSLKPDVITLDINMPRMDGLTFLGKLMAHMPLPVVVVSAISTEGSQQALRALALGAVDIFAKPGGHDNQAQAMAVLIQKVKNAATARPNVPAAAPGNRPAKAAGPTSSLGRSSNRLIAIGASTGGTVAIEKVLGGMPADTPPIVIVQHMPTAFTGPFADRLNRALPFEVREAVDGDEIRQGRCLISPGSHHLKVERSGGRLVARLDDGPAHNHHRPSVDIMFETVAKNLAGTAIGVLLTGMGRDGAEGLRHMQQSGSPTVAQDEATCVVYGMPAAAVELGAADEVLPIDRIADHLLHLERRHRQTATPAGH